MVIGDDRRSSATSEGTDPGYAASQYLDTPLDTPSGFAAYPYHRILTKFWMRTILRTILAWYRDNSKVKYTAWLADRAGGLLNS
jgi:hypothetical protein